MIGIDVEKMLHPFTKMLADFDKQMDQLHKEVQRSNKLLEEITQQNHTLGCMLERELKYVNQGVRLDKSGEGKN